MLNKKYIILTAFFFLLIQSSVLAQKKNKNSMPADFLEIINPAFRSNLELKLNKNISVHFDNTHVRDIVQFIINSGSLSVIMDESPFGNEPHIASNEAPYTSSKADDINEFANNVKKAKFVLTIHLNDMPIRKILWYLCQKTDLMAFWDEDIAENIPGPLIITSKKNADKIINEKIARRKRKLRFKRAVNSFKQPWR